MNDSTTRQPGAPAELTGPGLARLAAWITEQGTATGDSAADMAATLAESPAMRAHAAVLLATGEAPQPLRDAARCLAVLAGDRLTRDLTARLTARLAAWIDREGITGNYDTAGIAARVVAQSHPGTLTRWLDEDAPYLRGMCKRIKDFDDLSRGEWVTENVRHGNRGGWS
jgi:hypothetical protein